MCMNCGCGELDERHGKEANIVIEDLRRAAAASGLDMSRTVRNMEASLRAFGDRELAASGARGQSGTDTAGVGRSSAGRDATHG